MNKNKPALCRISMARATLSGAVFAGPLDREVVVSGYLTGVEGAVPPPAPPEIVERIEADEPDPETEVSYSNNIFEPNTLIFRGKKEKLSEIPFIFFRYLYTLHRVKGQTEFAYTDIIIAFRKHKILMTDESIESHVKRLRAKLKRMDAPISVSQGN